MVLTADKSCPAWLLPNDGETGYYQVDYKNGLLDKTLADKGRHLTVAERVGVLGNVETLENTGEISPRAALALAPDFANDPDYQVVSQAASIAGILRGNAVPDDLRPKGAQFVRQVFGKRAAELGWIAKPGESEDTRLLRQRLVSLLTNASAERRRNPQPQKITER